MLFRYFYSSQRDLKWRFFLILHLQCSLGAIFSKIHQYCFMERLLSLSPVIPLLLDSSIQETQAALHFLTVRIIISPSVIQSLTSPQPSETVTKTHKERKENVLSPCQYIYTTHLSVLTWARNESPLGGYFLASVSNTWGAHFHLRKNPIASNNNWNSMQAMCQGENKSSFTFL